jgi:hypothetical protein
MTDLDMFLLNHSVKKIDNMEFARHRNEVDELAGQSCTRIKTTILLMSQRKQVKANP